MNDNDCGLSFSFDKQEVPYYGAYSSIPLTIRGYFSILGPQSEKNVPELVDQLFKTIPSLDQVALNTIESGAVYTRRGGALSKKASEPKPEPDVEKFAKLIEVAGFTILKKFHLVNQYDSRSEDDPWLMVFTDMGYIIMGWRKRVISIDWEGMPDVRGTITDDDVTKENCMVHAWGMEKALTYLTNLHGFYIKAKASKI